MGKRLAKVESIFFGLQDHGILTLEITLDYGGERQVFGGVALSLYHKEAKRHVGHASGTDFVLRILQLFDVSELGKIVGRTVYALLEDNEYSAKIIGLKVPEFNSGGSFILKEWQKEWEGKNA